LVTNSNNKQHLIWQSFENFSLLQVNLFTCFMLYNGTGSIGLVYHLTNLQYIHFLCDCPTATDSLDFKNNPICVFVFLKDLKFKMNTLANYKPTQLNIYQKLLKEHQEDLTQLKYRYNVISVLRFVCVAVFIIAFYFYYKSNGSYLLAIMGLAGLIFFGLIKIHQKLSFLVKFRKSIITITENEINFIDGQNIPFKNGVEFETHKHFYTYDLDVFEESGLFQHLNRTATYIGSKTLAGLLQNPLAHEEILLNQNAVKSIVIKKPTKS